MPDDRCLPDFFTGKVLRQDRRLKELETQLRRETLHRAELEEAGDSAKRRFEAEIEEAEKAIENGEVPTAMEAMCRWTVA